MDEQANLRWMIVATGAWDIWPFTTDEWHLWCGYPSEGRVALKSLHPAGPDPTYEDAQWIADAMAFDHDAPIGVQPAVTGSAWDPGSRIVDQTIRNPNPPIHPLFEAQRDRYWVALSEAHEVAAELRFNGTFAFRYELADGYRWRTAGSQRASETVSTAFELRFGERRNMLAMYAMAARQADVMSEYLCLYRVLEAADGKNGMTFTKQYPEILDTDFGELAIYDPVVEGESINAFDVYKRRAGLELASLNADNVDVPQYLYELRNGLAHGKRKLLTSGNLGALESIARAVPIVKLLARLAIEGQTLSAT